MKTNKTAGPPDAPDGPAAQDTTRKASPVTDQSLPNPAGYAAVATELRRVADALDALPPPPVQKPPYVVLSILPADKTVEAVDEIALAVLGKRGTTTRDPDGWRHKAESFAFGMVYVSTHAIVPGPPDERDAELERLRAEVAELRGEKPSDDE